MFFNFLCTYNMKFFSNLRMGQGICGPNLAVLTQAKSPLTQEESFLMQFTTQGQTQRGAGLSHFANTEKLALMQKGG